ncbi:MAG: hypothetical protein IT307_12995 [Chloroflexi bacterium]|nr:hypothetical protein [Chloroflexota bacterium]
MHLDTNLTEPCPLGFTETNSTELVELCCEIEPEDALGGSDGSESVLGRLERALALNLAQLRKVAAAEPPATAIGQVTGHGDGNAGAEANGLHDDRTRGFFFELELVDDEWQQSEDLAECVRGLLRALDERPELASELDIRWDYVAEGWLQYDLQDLLRMLEWAVERGATRVRLWTG